MLLWKIMDEIQNRTYFLKKLSTLKNTLTAEQILSCLQMLFSPWNSDSSKDNWNSNIKHIFGLYLRPSLQLFSSWNILDVMDQPPKIPHPHHEVGGCLFNL